MSMDKFMREALREVDEIGWAAPPVSPPPTREETARQLADLEKAQLDAQIRAVREEAGDDPYQQAAAEERFRFQAGRSR
jgi:hypothetical protein